MKRIVIAIVVFGVIALLAGWFLMNKPHRSVSSEHAISVTPQSIVELYTSNEKLADSLYLDKVIEVTATVDSVYRNQEGKQVLQLHTGDPFYGVTCTLAKEAQIEKNTQYLIRGICSGFLSDVVLRESEVVNAIEK